MITENTSEVRTEISVGWAAANPSLFKEVYEDFFDTHEKEFNITSSVRRGFITLIAMRKEN